MSNKTKKELSKVRSESGKLGALATHRKRYEMLAEVSKKVDKKQLDYIQTHFDTKQIAILLKVWAGIK